MGSSLSAAICIFQCLLHTFQLTFIKLTALSLNLIEHGGLSLFAGVGERTREGNDLYSEMQDSSIISLQLLYNQALQYFLYQPLFSSQHSQVLLVFGQMNETPGNRMRVTHASLSAAEYFRDASYQDVLLFIDNVFRFLQAGSEVSTLLGGRMPSAFIS